MTFLNPLVLFGLVAATIPLILHLLSLRKLRTIEFSTLTFLKELQRTSIRRLKLRQILLLIIRTALIIAIVLAFARPALRGSVLGAVGSHTHTSAIILLDDSFSMAAADQRGELFRQAKEMTQEIISMLKEGDEVLLLRLSDLPRQTIERPTHDFSGLGKLVAQSELSFADGSLDHAMRTCAKVLPNTHNANKEVYVVSDLQRTLLPQRSGSSDRTQVENLFLPETKFFPVQVGSQDIQNATVDSVAVVSRILEKGKPVNITARVSNFGNLPLHDFVASVYLDGNRVAQRNADIEAWGSTNLDFTIIPQRTGLVGGYVATEQDAVEQDNKRYFAFKVPEKVHVVFLSPSPEDVRFISLALAASANENAHALFNVRSVPSQQFSLLDLQHVDVLVFSNVPNFTLADADRIKLFLQEGGGVLIFPGNFTSTENYNTTVLQALNIPPFEGRSGSAGESQGSLVFQHVDANHPIFAGVFEPTEKKKEMSVESPQVFVSVKRQTGKHGRTIISLSDQTPFLSEYRIGEGLVLVFSSASTPTWTDFPLKGIFAPLVYRSILHTAAESEQPLAVTVGEEPLIKLRRPPESTANLTAQRFSLRSPDGTKEFLQPQFQSTSLGSMITFSGRKFTQPGLYEIHTGQTAVARFAVNLAKEESDLRIMSNAELERFFKSIGVSASQLTMVKPGSKFETIVLQTRYGVELWKFFLVAALLLALLEMTIAREFSTREHQAIVASAS